PGLDAERIARLINELDDEQYAAREGAARALTPLAPLIAPELRRRLPGADGELRRRLQLLLLHAERSPFCAEHVRTVRALETLDRVGNSSVRDLLEQHVRQDTWLATEARSMLQRLRR